MTRYRLPAAILASFLFTHWAIAQGLPDRVDPMLGVRFGEGSCVPGPCLPHASIYPSPDTLGYSTPGYVPGKELVGFSQLHTQGTGGRSSYGNFLVSPQIGLSIDEKDHTSALVDELAKCFAYKVKLAKYGIRCELAPSRHSALYRFTFPASKESHIVLDAARKIPDGKRISEVALTSGEVSIDPVSGVISGGGTFGANWNPAPYRLYFCAKLSRKPNSVGTWVDQSVQPGVSKASAEKKSLGAFARFETKENETIALKIAVSFKSVQQAAVWLEQEIPGWDMNALQASAKAEWDKALAAVTPEGYLPAEANRFYSHLYHTMTQPRNRTGDNGNWESNAPFYDDHYTLWDTWKTLFPLMAIISPDVVRDNVHSFIDRYQHNGYVSTAFIQGQEYKVGQGGDEADNIICDAYVKGIEGINWEEAYQTLRGNAEAGRTPDYKKLGWVSHKEKTDYCGRLKSGSGTIGFSYNDWCVAQVANGLGKTEDSQRYLQRSANWKNVWDSTLEDSGFTGFIRARKADGTFLTTAARQGYNTDFYEGSCWVYSYVIPHDVTGMIEKMGGKKRFIERLCYAMKNGLIDFTNEPSFMTIWWFDAVDRPYLASHWANQLRQIFDAKGCPGDDDSGAMGSLFVFLESGFFPIAGQDIYYLHGPRIGKMSFHLSNGKTFAVVGKNASANNIYVQSAMLNGKPLGKPWIRHQDIVSGGVLEFTMGDQPSPWGCAGEFDSLKAQEELAEAK